MLPAILPAGVEAEPHRATRSYRTMRLCGGQVFKAGPPKLWGRRRSRKVGENVMDWRNLLSSLFFFCMCVLWLLWNRMWSIGASRYFDESEDQEVVSMLLSVVGSIREVKGWNKTKDFQWSVLYTCVFTFVMCSACFIFFYWFFCFPYFFRFCWLSPLQLTETALIISYIDIEV